MIAGDANPLVSAGIAGLNALHQRRDVTPMETLEAHLARIARLDPALNALVALDEAGARAAALASAARWRAGKPIGPLDGAPIVVKANIAVRGMPWTGAIAAYRARIAAHDSAITARLRAAGAMILGLANMHEAALGATTISPLYGPCINPLRAGYTPGGSSGGSAAAVAARFAAGALGTDTMGSVRIPSAYCGIVGFKPSAGRLARTGIVPLSAFLDHAGVHARTVADAAALFHALEGRDDADEASLSYAPAIKPRARQRLRIAWLTGDEPACTPEVAAAMAAIQPRLAELGDLKPASWGRVEASALRRMGLLICEADFLAAHGAALDPEGAISPGLRALLAFGAGQTAVKLAQAYTAAQPVCAWLSDIFQHADILITPTAPQTAFPHTEPAPATQADFTAFANFAGCPALSLPAPVAARALPVGVQVIAPRGADALVLSAAALIERAFA
jgi:aspartyl-tRNA(Asn)/glutamyl-tRNA(Gln) amidotransferase subunit A